MDRDSLTKKLIYQSNHRGCKELDYVLGRFATLENFAQMELEMLILYTEMLELNDWDLYNMLTMKAESGKFEALMATILHAHSQKCWS